MVTFSHGWKYRHYFIVVTVIVILILLKVYILAIFASFCNLSDICMHDCVKEISNLIYYWL